MTQVVDSYSSPYFLPLQQAHLLVFDRLADLQCFEHLRLCIADGAHFFHRLGLVDTHFVALNLSLMGQGPLRTQITFGLFQPLTHHPVDNQRHEANLRMRLDSVW